MFSEELTKYLYSYKKQKKEEPVKRLETKKTELPLLKILKKAYITSPANLHHEQ